MDVQILHKGTIENGKLIFDYPNIYKSRLDSLEGKRFEMVLEQEHEKVTKDQWGYLYGGIIRGTCMKTEFFKGWSFDEIRDGLLEELRTGIKIVVEDGKSSPKKYKDDLKQYSIQEMSLYIEDVLNFLGTLDIHPLPPDYYKYGINIQTKK